MFIAMFAIYVWIILLLPNFILSHTEPLGTWGAIANVLVPAGFYALYLTLRRNIGVMTLWCIPFFYMTSIELVQLKLYGRSTMATDMWLNMFTTNSNETKELLSGLGRIVVVVGTLYIFAIVCGIVGCTRVWRLPKRFVKPARVTGTVLLVAGGLCVIPAVATKPGYNFVESVFPINALDNLGRAITVGRRTINYHETSKDYAFNARSTVSDTVPELYVLVVGETSRARNWQLFGYERPTNPLLSQRANLVTYPKALSESNTTYKSVPMLLSEVSSRNYDVLPTVKSLITAFKEAGFATAVISAQTPNRSYIEYFTDEADTTLYLRNVLDPKHEITDLDLVPFARKAIDARAKKQLILIHAYGSHFNYRDRYPRDLAKFKPDGPYRAMASDRAMMVNAYDNSILATDKLLDTLIGMVDATGVQSALLYTSDHGEDIFDDANNHFLHSSPIPTAEQLHVPLLVWMSDAYVRNRPAVKPALEANKNKIVSTSRSYFNTALGLAGIVTDKADNTAALTSKTYKALNPQFVTDANEGEALQDLFGAYDEPLPSFMTTKIH